MFGITVKELGELIGISSHGVHKFLKENQIKYSPNKNTYSISPTSIEKILELRGIEKKKLVITCTCVKGGVGKTTMAHALATKFAQWGHKVLAIDMDQQSNLTTSLNVDPDLNEHKTFLNLFTGHFNGKKIGLSDAILNVEDHLDLIPSNLKIEGLNNELSSSNKNISKVFADIISKAKLNYDIIVIDTPPSLSKTTIAAYTIADLILVPICPDKYSMDGLELTMGNIMTLSQEYGINPDIKLVVNKMDLRSKLAISLLTSLSSSENYKDLLSQSYISTSKNIDNAICSRKYIWDMEFKSQAQEDLLSLCKEILNTQVWIKNIQGRKSSSHQVEVSHGQI